jgi:hypothetical protein
VLVSGIYHGINGGSYASSNPFLSENAAKPSTKTHFAEARVLPSTHGWDCYVGRYLPVPGRRTELASAPFVGLSESRQSQHGGESEMLINASVLALQRIKFYQVVRGMLPLILGVKGSGRDYRNERQHLPTFVNIWSARTLSSPSLFRLLLRTQGDATPADYWHFPASPPTDTQDERDYATPDYNGYSFFGTASSTFRRYFPL